MICRLIALLLGLTVKKLLQVLQQLFYQAAAVAYAVCLVFPGDRSYNTLIRNPCINMSRYRLKEAV